VSGDVAEPEAMALHAIIRAFLEIALVHPAKAPKTQRAERDNTMMIIGFNRAQEDLRSLLAAHGVNEAARSLAEVRSENQQRPIDVGGHKTWVAG
jgi:hypothetical protein